MTDVAAFPGTKARCAGNVPRIARRARWILPVALVIMLSSGGGAAFAYLHSTGTGSGNGTTGTPVSATVSAATSAADLFPGHTGTVKFTLKNANGFTANFNSVTAASVRSGNELNCAASNIQVASLPYSVPTISVSPGQTTGTNTIGGLISMSSSAPSTCQGVSFSISLTLSGQSN